MNSPRIHPCAIVNVHCGNNVRVVEPVTLYGCMRGEQNPEKVSFSLD